jgi:hypothetical protein
VVVEDRHGNLIRTEEEVVVDMMTVIGRGMTGGMIMRAEVVVVDTNKRKRVSEERRRHST